jgi:ferritin-like metal-binding protein YciE
MEQAVMEVLEQHSSDAENVEIKTLIEEKIESVHENSEKVKERVEELGDEVITGKTSLASIIRNMEQYPSGYEKNKTIKDVIIEYGLYYLEKAVYKAIIFAAKECNDQKTVSLCEKIIGNEIETAEYLDQNLGDIMIDYVNRKTIEKRKIDYTGEDDDEL